MKLLKRTICLMLIMIFSLSVIGCGKQSGSVSATDVEIYGWKAGYGEEFLNKTVEKFNSIQDKYHVTCEMDANSDAIMQSLELGKNNTYDLYFTILNTTRFNKSFIDLSGLLNENTYNEEIKLKDKYNSEIIKGVTESDKTVKTLTWGGGFYGLVYNNLMISDERLPRTTDQLNYLVTELKDETVIINGIEKNIVPLIMFNDPSGNGYWEYLLFTWEAQYDGTDYYYNNMLELKDENGNAPSKDVFKRKDGRYKALKVLEQILNSDTVHGLSTSTNFTSVQTNFLEGEAAIMANGSWLKNESKGSQSENLRMMKMPVISAIVEKLEDKNMSDETLAEIVDEVDAGNSFDNKNLCSENDFNRIKEARNMLFNNGCESLVFIPEYSPAIEGAKEFLKYYYSDEGLVTFIETTGTPTTLKFYDENKFNIDNLDAWGKQQYEYMRDLTYITDRKDKSDLLVNASINHIAGLSFSQPLINVNIKDKKNADELWGMMETRIDEMWDMWLKNI